MSPEIAAAVLDVSITATDEQVQVAYRRRARLLHPDRFVGASEQEAAEATRAFARLNLAREVLLGRPRESSGGRTDAGGPGSSSPPSDRARTAGNGPPRTAPSGPPTQSDRVAASQVTNPSPATLVVVVGAVLLLLGGYVAADGRVTLPSWAARQVSAAAPAAELDVQSTGEPAEPLVSSPDITDDAEEEAAPGQGFAEAELDALVLQPADLTATDVSVLRNVTSQRFSPASYAAANNASIEPEWCQIAKGIMVMEDADAVGSGDWNRITILRRNDLKVEGDSSPGSQQIRQFESTAQAERFMQSQVEWFSRCAEANYTFASGKAVRFSGQIDERVGTDLLLTSATDHGGNATAEFNGWARVGATVYGAFLLADGPVQRQDLRVAGSSIMQAAVTKLHRLE